MSFYQHAEVRKSNFLTMARSDRVLDAYVKESKCFCPVVVKGVFNVVNEEEAIPPKVKEILEDFHERTLDELPNKLPLMQDI